VSTQKSLFELYIQNNHVSDNENTIQSINDELIIFPTLLLSQQYKRYLIKKGIPFNPDLITTLDDFCRMYHDSHAEKTRIISDGQALTILSATLEDIKAEVPFFFPRNYPSTATIQDLLDLRSIFSQRVIDFSQHPLVTSSEKCHQILLALTSYEKALEKNYLLDNSALINWTISHIGQRKDIIYSKIRIHRLFEFFPREKNLILALRDHSDLFRLEYLKGLDYDLFNPPDWISPHEISYIEYAQEIYNRTDIFTKNPTIRTDNSIKAQVFSSTIEELEAIAEEIHALNTEGEKLSDIAIVFPKILSFFPKIQEVLDDFGIASYSFAGEPLIREPVIGSILLFPSLVMGDYPREDVINLLSNPYFNVRPAELGITIAEFDQIIRAAGIEGGYEWEIPLHNLKENIDELRKTCSWISEEKIEESITWIKKIQEICNTFSENLTPDGYTARFNDLIYSRMDKNLYTSWSDQPDSLLTRESKALKHFQGCLSRLSSLFKPGEKIELTQYMRYLTHLLLEPVNLTKDSGGVRIMGMRQVVGMEYSCIFFGGLVEGDIPYPSTRFPLLNSEESIQLGSRGLEEVIHGEKYYFISTLCAGKKIFLSAPHSRKEKPVLTSSFFEQVVKGKKPSQWGREIIHSQKRAAILAGKCIAKRYVPTIECPENPLTWLSKSHTYGEVAQRILIEDWYRTGIAHSVYDGIVSDDKETINWLCGPKMFGSDHIWSPSQLETYASCPFRFFLERIIRIRPLTDVDPTLSSARKGTLIHDILNDFFTQWCEIKPQKITLLDLDEATKLLYRIAIEKTGRYRFQSPAWHATVASLLDEENNAGLLWRFLRHEAENDGDLVPTYFEYPIKPGNITEKNDAGFVVLVTDNGESIKIQGRVDRVDRTPEGLFTIIDYKTGTSYPNRARVTEGKALQLPLYLLALEKMTEHEPIPLIGIGGSYLEISRKIKQTWPLQDPGYRHYTRAASGTKNFREILNSSLTFAHQYITGIRSGKFHVAQETCNNSLYCPYSDICRFNRFRDMETDETEGE